MIASSSAFAQFFFGLDDFGHGHAELVLDQHHFAAGHQPVVDVDVDRFADLAVELQHAAGPEPEQLADVHAGAAQHRRNLHRHVEHRFEIGRRAVRRFVGLRQRRRIDRRRGGAVLQIGQRNLAVVTHAEISPRSGRIGPRGYIGAFRRAGGDIAADHFGDRRFGFDAVAGDAAVRPFDAAVAERDVRLGDHHEAAFEAAGAGGVAEALLCGGEQRRR